MCAPEPSGQTWTWKGNVGVKNKHESSPAGNYDFQDYFFGTK